MLFRSAETEKYAHITYFINGGSADPVNGEMRVRIPSPRLKSYALRPEMSVYAITKTVKKAIEQARYDFIAVNFANPDMVGHTGDMKAVISAIGHVDQCLKTLSDLILKKHGTLIVTADHGNAEKMIDLETNEIWTGHTTNPVPFILAGDGFKGIKLKAGGRLANIAPTIYDVFGFTKISKIINKSLIKK